MKARKIDGYMALASGKSAANELPVISQSHLFRSFLSALVVAGLAGLPAAGATLYGVTGDGATVPATLYTIDKTTVVPTFFQTLVKSDGGEVVGFNPADGLMYHFAGNNTPTMESLNLASHAATPVPTTGFSHNEVFSATWDAANGRFLLTTIANELVASSTTGLQSLIGVINVESRTARGLAFVGTTLYAGNAFNSSFYTINPATGAVTSTTSVTMPGNTPSGILSLATDPDTGILWAIVKTGGGGEGLVAGGITPGAQGINGRFVGTINPATAVFSPVGLLPDQFSNIAFAGSPSTYLVSYASNLASGDSFVNISNTGASGAALQSGTTASITGAVCANVYAFTPDEQLVSCCSCPVTPNGLVSLSAKNDLASNTLTPAVPTALVIKVVGSAPVAGSCTNSAAAVTTNARVPGLVAWGSTLHATPAAGTLAVTETNFSIATLSPGELNRLGQLCNFILANGSGFGVCRSCRLGGLGATRQ